VFSGFGDNTEFTALDSLFDCRRISAQFKKVVFFFELFVFTVVIRANAVVCFDNSLSYERLTTRTVPTLVAVFVNIFGKRFPDKLSSLLVTSISCTYKTIVADIQCLLQFAELLADLIGKSLGFQAKFFG